MASFCSNCDEVICACSHPNQVPRYELEETVCEWPKCEKPARHLDFYVTKQLCDEHYKII